MNSANSTVGSPASASVDLVPLIAHPARWDLPKALTPARFRRAQRRPLHRLAPTTMVRPRAQGLSSTRLQPRPRGQGAVGVVGVLAGGPAPLNIPSSLAPACEVAGVTLAENGLALELFRGSHRAGCAVRGTNARARGRPHLAVCAVHRTNNRTSTPVRWSAVPWVLPEVS